jgi:hypothetical protein
MRLNSAIVLLGVVWILLANVESSAGTSKVVFYKDPARTFFEKFSTDSWEGGNLVPKKPLKSQKDDILFDETTGFRLHDCSNATYLCVFGSFRVFALPRNRLSPGATYAVGGSVFKVEECFRGDAKICQAALISSSCQKQLGVDACEQVIVDHENNREPGPIVYFIYNEDHGVTAYGTVKKPPQTRGEKLAIATQMILQGDVGILAN